MTRAAVVPGRAVDHLARNIESTADMSFAIGEARCGAFGTQRQILSTSRAQRLCLRCRRTVGAEAPDAYAAWHDPRSMDHGS